MNVNHYIIRKYMNHIIIILLITKSSPSLRLLTHLSSGQGLPPLPVNVLLGAGGPGHWSVDRLHHSVHHVDRLHLVTRGNGHVTWHTAANVWLTPYPGESLLLLLVAKTAILLQSPDRRQLVCSEQLSLEAACSEQLSQAVFCSEQIQAAVCSARTQAA